MVRVGVLSAAFGAVVLLVTPVQAGDYNWTGLYVGAHGGYGWAEIDYPGAPPYPDGPPRPSLEGGLVGGQLGYNFQFDRVVIGVEGDWSFAKLTDTERDGNYITQSYEINGLGSVRGRLGVAFGHLLPYVTGGWAWGDTKFNQTCPSGATHHCATAGPYSKTASETVQGFVYGGGVEVLIAPNWSLRSEFLHYDFDDQDYALGKSPSSYELGSKKLEHEVDVARFAISYKFGGRSEPAPLK